MTFFLYTLLITVLFLNGTIKTGLTLPTPDVLVNTFQIFPLIMTTIAGLFAGVGIYLKKHFDKIKNPTQTLLIVCSVLLTCLIICFSLLTLEKIKSNNEERISHTEMYFRSDQDIDQIEISAAANNKVWFEKGIIKKISMSEISEFTDYHTKPIFLDLDRLRLRHDTGFLAMNYKGNLEKFEFIYPSEFQSYLELLIKEDTNNTQRPVLIYNWDRFTIWRDFKNCQEVAKLLNLFQDVYAINSIYGREIIARNYPFLKICIHDPKTKKIEPTEKISGIIKYPVRNEKIVYNEEYGYFKNIFHLIDVQTLIRYAKDPDIIIVAPYNSLFRSKEVYQYYLYRYFQGVNPERIVFIDFNSPDLRESIKQLSFELQGNKFLTVGITKQDWIYMGIDIAHEVWRHYGRNTPESFKYLGSSLQTAKMAAINSIKESSISKKIYKKCEQMIHSLIVSFKNKFNIPIALSIMLLAVLIRAVLIPIGYVETRSRLLRTDLRNYIHHKDQPASKKHYLLAYEDLILKKLGCSKFVEILGCLLALTLILPFFKVLSSLPMDTKDLSLWWIDNISDPSISISVILFGIITVKISVSRFTRDSISLKIKNILIFLFLIPLFILFTKIPSVLGLFAVGIIGTQLFIDIFARVRTSNIIKKELSPQFQAIRTMNRESHIKRKVILLEESAGMHDIGNKGRRLGELRHSRSSLFTVPKGIILTPECLNYFVIDETNYEKLILPEIENIFPIKESTPYAVRSCGSNEDGSGGSLAGKFDTVLNVKKSGMKKAIRSVIRSFNSPEQNSDAVIIQEMADVDIAGVMFTAAPDNPFLTLIEYAEGLADRLVSGMVVPAQIFIGNCSGHILGGQEETSLTPREKDSRFYQHLFIVGKYIEENFNHPQDIEWGYNFKKEKLYILQSRDIVAFVDDKKVSGEQDRILQAVVPGKKNISMKSIYKHSDMDEVVDESSEFTISLMKELYANDGAFGHALRGLGFILSKCDIPCIEYFFGRFYSSIQPSYNKFHPRNIYNEFRLRRILKTGFQNSFLHRIETKVTAIERQYDDDYAIEPESLPDLVKHIVHKIDIFIKRIYPIAFEATFLANYAGGMLKIGKRTADGNSPLIKTKMTRMFEALSSLAQNPDEIDMFIQEWGHRSPNDYDLAADSFRDDRHYTIQYADQFKHFAVSDNVIEASECSSGSLTDTYHRLIYLKEIAKDAALRHLRSVKPLFQQLAIDVNISTPSVFFLHVNDLRELAEADTNLRTIIPLIIKQRKKRHNENSVDLPDILSIENIEFLSKLILAENSSEQGRSEKNGKTLKGVMVSAQKKFAGVPRIVEGKTDFKKDYTRKDILVTKDLTPKLVPLFTKVSGCISENGGRLSHAAIVAREMNFPILVGVSLNQKNYLGNSEIQVNENGSIESLNI